ncbi:ABC transporter ATP-binding protein [Candidatus Magnetominusculus dajiuhuensis]|uniref:ABC transporter ATP-binding protein n=1 Tax=Candidatus Magnetominusculus dajiuhuensis TaxID=3137712 RepID=UPI003B437ECD
MEINTGRDRGGVPTGGDAVIEAVDLTKVYKLYKRAIDRLKEAVNPFKKQYHEDFYALRDVSFKAIKGRTVGIIGKNGAGKSTLLQILTGVLTPTSGMLTKSGRLSALLELGAGFNPELTGIENIYFNGTIMGYTRAEIDERLGEIISFADIGEFIYQPVKSFSSGMFVRLAFAVSVSVDPDILIIDEALSVGDIRFQIKCFRKITDFKNSGKCIILVSHDIGAIKRLCDSVIWLRDGQVYLTGEPEYVCKEYMSYMFYDGSTTENKYTLAPESTASGDTIEWEDVRGYASFGEGGAEIRRVIMISCETNRRINILRGGERVKFLVEADIKGNIVSPGCGITLKDNYGTYIFTINNYIYNVQIEPFTDTLKLHVEFEFYFPTLKSGNYSFSVSISDGTVESHIQNHWIHEAYVVQLINSDIKYNMGCILIIENVAIKVNTDRLE